MQSRRMSLIESCTNVLLGFFLSMGATFLILPVFGFGSPNIAQAGGMTAVYTLISIARSYGVRRGFNWLHARRQDARFFSGF